jgi:DNA-binding transcriptional LysR family regulator
MDFRPKDFDWNQARAFLATVEEGSLSAAARVLRLTQPTLSRQVAALEEQLGVVLFERVGHKLTPTPSGMDLAEHVGAMRDAANRVSLMASGQSQSIEGLVRVTASDIFSASLLPPLLLDLQALAPRLEVDVVAANDIRDLQRREADIAIRHVRPEQPHLVARLISEQSARLYAASSYLDRRGRPKTPEDLAAHDLVGIGDIDRMVGFMNAMGLPVSSKNIRAGSDNGLVAWEMVKTGLGIMAMADVVAEPCKEIEVVLPETDPVIFPVWLTTHREVQTSRRIRLVYDFLADSLSRVGAAPRE